MSERTEFREMGYQFHVSNKRWCVVYTHHNHNKKMQWCQYKEVIGKEYTPMRAHTPRRKRSEQELLNNEAALQCAREHQAVLRALRRIGV